MLVAFVGFAGAVTTSLIAAPQAVRAVRVGTAGVSAATFQLFLGLALMWMIYAVSQQYWTMFAGNAINFVACMVTLVACRRNGASLRSVTAICGVMLAVTLGTLAGGGVLLMTWSAVGIGVLVRIPQIKAVIQSHAIHGVSIFTWWMAVSTNACFLIYGIANRDIRLEVSTVVNGTLSAVIVCIVARRRTQEGLVVSALP